MPTLVKKIKIRLAFMQAFKRALFFLLLPTFLICSYFFMKMPYYPYFFTLKCHSRVEKSRKFPSVASLARILYINCYVYSGGTPVKHPKFLFLTQKSLFLASAIVTSIIMLILYEISYFKQLIVMNFVLGKALLSLLFYTNNPYFFTTFSRVLTRIFENRIHRIHPWKKLESKLKNWSLTWKSWSFLF